MRKSVPTAMRSPARALVFLSAFLFIEGNAHLALYTGAGDILISTLARARHKSKEHELLRLVYAYAKAIRIVFPHPPLLGCYRYFRGAASPGIAALLWPD